METMGKIAGVFYAVVLGFVAVAIAFLVYDCNVKTARIEATQPRATTRQLTCTCVAHGDVDAGQ